MSLYLWTALCGAVASIVTSIVAPLVIVFDVLISLVMPRPPAPEPRVVLITGATSGIGAALAEDYAKDGMTLVLSGRNADALAETAALCEKKGAAVITKKLDVTDEEGMRAWIEAVDAEHPIDVVVANAGVTEATTKTQNNPGAAARVVLPINITGVMNTVVPVIEPMKRRGSGQIVLVSSLAGFGPLTGSSAYSASKAAIKTWGEALRTELLCFGVRVNVVCPGFVSSPMTAANSFRMPGIIGMPEAIASIREGVAADLPVVAFPASLYTVSEMMGAMPAAAREAMARFGLLRGLFFYRRKPRAGHAASAGGAASKRE